MKRFIKQHNRLIVCLLLTAFSLVFTFARFNAAFSIIESAAKEMWSSLTVYWRFSLFGRTPLPSDRPILSLPEDISNILPSNISELCENLSQFFSLLFTGENFIGYAAAFASLLSFMWQILPFVVLIFVFLHLYLKSAFTKHNNRYNQDTRPLKAFKWLSDALYSPVKKYLLHWLEFVLDSPFPRIWLLIWLFNFNVFAVLLMLLSIACFFFATFDLVSLYYFVCNSIAALMPAFRFVPTLFWLVLGYWLFDRWRKKIALDRLRHMEKMNKGFIKERGLCVMLVGGVGTGKTETSTDMDLSSEAIFRFEASERMLDNDLKFPHFPYINFENALKKEISSGSVFNLASCGEWVDKVSLRFKFAKDFSTGLSARQQERVLQQAQKHGVSREIALQYLSPKDIVFDYDWLKYGLYYDDKKTLTYIFDALKDYAKLYIIYVTQTSLIISNYGIRTDFIKADAGNMPMWDLDFFERDSRHLDKLSKQSHILDFDMLRLGEKMNENNKRSNCFEFGVISITEIAKEEGNQLDEQEVNRDIKHLRDMLKELKELGEDTTRKKSELDYLRTQLKSKINNAIKLMRHKATVDYFPFVRFFVDDQRPESLGADARDLFEIIHIQEKGETSLAMPFYFIGELVHDFIFPRFMRTYQEYRFNRGDNTLLMHLLKKISAWIHSSYKRTYNRFGYKARKLAVEESATGKILKESNYYIATKKIHANRFSTDAYGDIFAENLKACGIGLNDIPTYAEVKASKEELQSQNSFFITKVIKGENHVEVPIEIQATGQVIENGPIVQANDW